MSAIKIHVCQCLHCQQEAFHQDKKLHHQMNLFLSRLDEQFVYIQMQKQIFQDAGLPTISVDTKKKEQIGNFKNAGQVWCKEADVVNVHDFPQDALGRAVPYGIYELNSNRGSVYIGTSADTPQFAVDVITSWWQDEGKTSYPHADELLILADGGGSNGLPLPHWLFSVESC